MALNDSTDYTSLLADIAGKKTLVTLYNGNGNSVDEVVLPITQGRLNDLLYRRWVKQREADTERMSGGRLGYVHLRSMDDASFRHIYTDLLGKYVDKEGIVIDTRWNGGGRLHEDIEMLFSGDKYLTQVIRGTDVCDMPSRRWNKPSIMLQCEANYSNAHGTPWVYKHKGMGKLVGMPVPGTMTSVNWGDTSGPVAHIRHSGNRISYCRRQLSGKLSARTGHKGCQRPRYCSERRRHPASDCRRRTFAPD